MLIADWTKQTEVSRGASVVRQGEPQLATSGDIVAAFTGFVSTIDLPDVPQFVHHVSSPSPYAHAMALLDQLAALAPGWDGHDAACVDARSAARARDFLNEVHNQYPGLVRPPMVGPLPDGSVALVWRTEKKEVGIDFADGGDTIEFAVTDRNGERPEEFQERVGIDSLLSFVVPEYLID